MPFSTIVLIGLALAMDAFAVSIASGIAIKHSHMRHALLLGCWFGGFQALMPALGWLAGVKLSAMIAGVDHWVAFGLLAFIGCKMIYEAFQMDKVEEEANPLETKVIFLLAVATSIDAFAVGISFAVLKVAIVTPALTIGAITFCTSFAGVLIGDKLGHLFEKKVEIAGGLILIGIGIRILITHLLE